MTMPPVVAPPVSLDGFLRDIGTRAFRFAEFGLRSRDDALDAVQDAMERMLRYGDRPAEEWPPLFWRILRTRMIDMQRRRNFRLGWMLGGADESEAGIAWADPAGDPSTAHDHREAYGRLARGLRGLPARQREAFTLRVLEELDVATTAQVMGCSEGSVKTHLSRAREALRPHLEDWK